MNKKDFQLTETIYATIGAISRLFLSDISHERLSMDIASLLISRLEAFAADVAIYDIATREIISIGRTRSSKEHHHERIALQSSIYHDVIESRQTVMDVNNTGQTSWLHSWMGQLGAASIVLVPISFHDRAIGALGIADKKRRKNLIRFSVHLQSIADHIAQEIMRRQTERELRKKEIFFRTMVDYQTEFVSRMSPDTTFRFVNETYLRYLDKFQEEVIGEKFIDLIAQSDRDSVNCQLQQLLMGSQAITVEHRWISPGEDIRWHRWTFRILADENNHPLEILGVGRDCTKEKKTQDIIKIREAQYRAVVEDQTELIARFNAEGMLVFANEAYRRYFSMENIQLPARHTMPKIFPQDIEAAFKGISSISAENTSGIMEFRLELPDGSYRWTQWSYMAILNPENAITEYQAVGRDIHELKQLQDMLEKNQQMLQGMFNGITDPIFILDETGSIKMANTATLRYYNAEGKEYLNKPCYRVFRNEQSLCRDCDIVDKVNHGNVRTFERESKVRSGMFEQVTTYPLRMAGFELPSAIVHMKDITKTRLLEKRVSHSERLASLGLLISGIAHEINNPNNFIAFNIPVLRDYLGAILPITDAYCDKHPGFCVFGMSYHDFKTDLCRLLDNMEHGSDRINRTVTGLREFMHNQGTKELVWADMHTVIDRAVMLCGSKVKNAVRAFTIEIDPAMPKVYTDPYALEHMLIILMINAAQAADKADSAIRLSIFPGTKWQEHMIVEVSDNGCGIPAENREKLFEPFFTTKASSGGTGLGLYICKDMINGLGGRIDIQSEPGSGTTVRLVFPDISSG